MELAALQWIAVALLGMFLALDHSAWPSVLGAQPLVGGLLGGWLGGHPMAGIAAGAVLQMVSMAAKPVGGVAVAEAWVAGFAAAVCTPDGVTLSGNAWLDDPRLAAPAVVGILAAAVGRWLVLAQRTLLERLGTRIASALASGDAAPAVRLHVFGCGLHALRGAALALAAAAFGPALSRVLSESGVEAPAGRIALALAAVALAGCAPRTHRALRLGFGLAVGALVAFVG